MFLETLKEYHFLSGFLIHLGCARHLGNTAFQHFEVGKDQFKVDRLNVAQRIYTSVHMDDIVVVEAPHNVDNGVHFPDIGQELVAESLALGSALDKTSYIDKFDNGRRHLFGMVHLAQKADPLIRHGNDPHIGIDGAERVVGRFRSRLRKRVEQCALPYIGKPDDA